MTYEALEIQGQNFEPMITNFPAAKSITSEFVELDTYEEPLEQYETVYKFKPKYK